MTWNLLNFFYNLDKNPPLHFWIPWYPLLQRSTGLLWFLGGGTSPSQSVRDPVNVCVHSWRHTHPDKHVHEHYYKTAHAVHHSGAFSRPAYRCQWPGSRRYPWPGEPSWGQPQADAPNPPACQGCHLWTHDGSSLSPASGTSPSSVWEKHSPVRKGVINRNLYLKNFFF